MPRPSARQPRRPRTVFSLSVPMEPDYTRACRAAGISGETLSDFIREAMRQRANRVLGKDDQKVPAEQPVGERQDSAA